MQLGQMILKMRKESKLTQEEFAEKLNVTRQTVSNWENDKSYPDLLTLIKISDTYNCFLDRMLREDVDMTEAMNRSIQFGNEYKKNNKISTISAWVGMICCGALVIISLIDFDGILEPILWSMALLMNMISVYIYGKKKKQMAQPPKTINAEDVEIIKKLIDRNMTVEAIKLVRKVYNVGLLEAKTFIDEIQKQKTENP